MRGGGGACVAHARPAASGAALDLSFKVYGDFAAVEAEWRRFERVAEMMPFQAFDWLAIWYRHIGPSDACGRRSWSDASPTARRRSSFRSASRPRLYAAAVLARRDRLRLSRAAARARLCATRAARGFSRCGGRCARVCRAGRGPATTGSNWKKCRRRSAASSIPSCCSISGSTPAARIRPDWAPTGNVLFRQAFVGDAPARPHQAQAHGGVRRRPLRHRRRY